MKFLAKVFPYLMALCSLVSTDRLQAKEQTLNAAEEKVYEPIRCYD
jgi:hypothetical protein